ncbi:hypothetical protein BXZ70DRAFT_959759 [Cristinia sonorae]|uniref:BTB domain-containing protein n=1 Tax=Cristinia sonorae TaxID=1940300 RepID=A0A8K0XKK0_9AGAR|nr:hypothetical protein BXZ70DRAFT_959759 [Cristinia sonorae]
MSLTLLDFPTLVRTDVWFSDGNVVLIAGSAAFRVHKGQLERHSEIFQDLFSVPQPEGQLLFEGCPWVELHDSPSDILHLLHALYDGLYFDKPSGDDFPAIAGVLRLSTKYMIEHLRQRCLVRLTTDWPSTLAGWDAREKVATDKDGRYGPREAYPHPLLVISLALELGITDVLPSAYLDLARYGPRRIVSGTPLPQPVISSVPLTGTKDCLEGKSRVLNSSRTPATDEEDILVPSHAELSAILRGREVGQRHIAMFIENELVSRPISGRCFNKHHDAGRACRESTYFVMLNILRAIGGISHGRDADPLFTLTQVVEMLGRTDFTDGVKQCGLKMCAACKMDVEECVVAARKDVWEQVPLWFDLGPWKGSKEEVVLDAEDSEEIARAI